MNPEDLLRPRYKVISDYPYSPYKIGDLVDITDAGTSFHCCTTKEWNEWENDFSDSQNYFSISYLEKFTALFKPLAWYEDRELKDMPEYVKAIAGNKVWKLLSPKHNGRIWHEDYEIEMIHIQRHGYNYLPATLTDYTQYLNSKK